MSERLADLDELVLRCRDKSTKEYIQEAVACYRAEAFRSCIVSTWNAVVFDFIHKLRQLEQTGHKNAKQKLEEFEELRAKQDISKMLAFEKNVPDLALKEYEFISPLEYSDLSRLLEDRNRCAHPSMQSLEETFQASAELARYHLRNAIMHLLQHPPVQGRAALDLIWTDIRSEYFPTEVEQAVAYFSSGTLARARKPLIRNMVVGLTKDLLLNDRPKAEQRVKQLPPEVLIQNFQTELPLEYMQPVVKDHIQSKVELFIQSSSSKEATTNGRALLQVVSLLSTEQLERILDALPIRWNYIDYCFKGTH